MKRDYIKPFSFPGILIFLFLFVIAEPGHAAQMTDYCQKPPFVTKTLKPNLLLMLDNSASMYDTTYIDETTTPKPYCYDNSYSSTKAYMGYFNRKVCSSSTNIACTTDAECPWPESCVTAFYQQVGDLLNLTTSFPASCTKWVSNTLCVALSSPTFTPGVPRKVTQFVASGNFLNWLTASKMDIEKLILTGGKFVDKVCSITKTTSCTTDSECPSGELCTAVANSFLKAETRGCAGRRFVKEPPGNCPSATPCASDVTFAVRGPSTNINKPSEGGQTYIEIFDGNYNQEPCQLVLTDLELDKHGDVKSDLEECFAYPPNSDLGTKLGPIFNQSVQACMALNDGVDISGDDVNSVKNKCSDIYNDLSCSLNNTIGCTTDADCVIGINNYGTCGLNSIPSLITPSSPGYLCSSAYEGRCWDAGLQTFTACIFKGPDKLCGDECVQEVHRLYCGQVNVPPVVDPSDTPSDTSVYQNVPAMMSDSGILAQLMQPMQTIAVNIKTASAPKGLLHEYEDIIRFGAMRFNYYGEPTECSIGGSGVGCTGYCSVSKTQVCFRNLDCPSGQTCVLGTSADGGSVVAEVSDKVGDYTTGLIKAVNDTRGATWTPYAEAFYNSIGYYAGRSDLRLNVLDFDATKRPVQYNCQKNAVLMVTDGNSTADLSKKVADQANSTLCYASQCNDGDGQTTTYPTYNNTCQRYAGSLNIDDLAWLAQNRDITDFTLLPQYEKDRIYTYVIFSGTGDTKLAGECNPQTLMQNTANNGAGTIQFAKSNDPDSLYAAFKSMLQTISAKSASGTAASVLASGEGTGANLIQALFYPKKKFFTKVCSINTGKTCDSDANCLAGEGRCINETEWAGTLQNLWYYVDPGLKYSNIREDTVADKKLNVLNDFVIQFYYDPVAQVTKAARSKQEATNPITYTPQPPDATFDTLGSLWEAGKLLWKRDVSTAANKRKIYTTIDGTSFLAGNFSADGNNGDSDKSSDLLPYLNLPSGDSDGDGFDDGDFNRNHVVGFLDAGILINYIHGKDYPVFRNRTVSIDLNGNGTTTSASDTGETNVWKLGDIVDSTPRLMTWLPLNLYHGYDYYQDVSYGPNRRKDPLIPSFSSLANDGHFITTAQYKSRGMVFVGANDGMLHAFRFGTLDPTKGSKGSHEVARLLRTCTGTSLKECTSDADCPGEKCPELGKEMWAFIPKNVLPYLKYLGDPNYCHLYTVDLTPVLVDASVEKPSSCTETNYWDCSKVQNKNESSWRTILIGGMRFGGGCKDATAPCTVDLNGDGLVNDKDCAKTPATDIGYSSYFALDVTDQYNPKLLWEFSHKDLGYSTSGPGIIRISAKDASGKPLPNEKNGRWFVVFGSGPTGPIDTINHQFYGFSDQNLKFFVFDLRQGPSSGFKVLEPNPAITDAFSGSLTSGVFDELISPQTYQDNAIYAGYTRKSAATGTWTAGGVVRILTNTDLHPENGTWEVTRLTDAADEDNIGPVTTSTAHLRDTKNGVAFIYFGSGRYYYGTEMAIDDPTNTRRLFGVKEPCYSSKKLNLPCSSTVSLASLTNVSNIAAVPADPWDPAFKGWYIGLESAGDYAYIEGTPPAITRKYWAERSTTDPFASTSLRTVFFTTFKPYNDACSIGGKTFLWAVDYSTGGVPDWLKGTAIMQVSTGAIEEKDLSNAFTDRDGRRTTAMEGVPPSAQGLSLLTSPPPLKRVIHVQER